MGEPKTSAAKRTISLPDFLIDELAAHLHRSGNDSEFVFTSPNGGCLRRSNFRRRYWLPAVRASVGEPLRYHDLRHSHVAILISMGEHPRLIANRLGHTSVRTVLDVYGHAYDDIDIAAAERLETLRMVCLGAHPRQMRASTASGLAG